LLNQSLAGRANILNRLGVTHDRDGHSGKNIALDYAVQPKTGKDDATMTLDGELITQTRCMQRR